MYWFIVGIAFASILVLVTLNDYWKKEPDDEDDDDDGGDDDNDEPMPIPPDDTVPDRQEIKELVSV